MPLINLATGAEMRTTGPPGAATVVCVNGGKSGDVEGTWSATLEWLVDRLAPRFPDLCFAEVRYRIRSWRRLDMCRDDARAAVREAAGPRTLMLGFSMGGAVAIPIADEASVEGVLGLAPWIPERMSLDPLRGKRFVVLHGAIDRYLPGISGVDPGNSRRGFDRAQALGVEGSYTLIPGAVHAMALRAPWGRPVALKGARRWEALVAEELRRFQDSG
jgi:pimeloyl-ACP methyl ester carboxylesterase